VETATGTTTETQAQALSARNQWPGTVRRVALERDGVLAEVVLDIGGQEVAAVITRASAERLGLREGERATAVVKATDVMIAR
jgi:molybdopterin-binding protein